MKGQDELTRALCFESVAIVSMRDGLTIGSEKIIGLELLGKEVQ